MRIYSNSFELMSELAIPAMFKNSIITGMRFLLCTVLMMVIYFIMTVVVIRFFTPAIIFGEGLCAFLCSCLLSNIMKLLEEKSISETSSPLRT